MLFSMSDSVLWICNTRLCISLCTSSFIVASLDGLDPEQYFNDRGVSESISKSSTTCLIIKRDETLIIIVQNKNLIQNNQTTCSRYETLR